MDRRAEEKEKNKTERIKRNRRRRRKRIRKKKAKYTAWLLRNWSLLGDGRGNFEEKECPWRCDCRWEKWL